jgi:hypothetical protein
MPGSYNKNLHLADRVMSEIHNTAGVVCDFEFLKLREIMQLVC